MIWGLIILVLVTVYVRVVQLLSLRSARISKIPAVRTLLIDNFDSYTYNIFQLIAEVNGVEPIVVYNNALSSDWSKVKEKYIFDNIVLSPGPGNPNNSEDFGLCMETITQSAGYPLLGVCLGHQGMVSAYGGDVVRAKTPMHGRLSALRHTGTGLFRGIPQGTNVVRYHSLAVQEPLPSELRATAWAADGTVMGLEHTGAPQYGVQFHPESVLTEAGRAMLTNFRDITLQHKMGLSERAEKHLTNRKAVVLFADKEKRLSASVGRQRRQHVQVTAFPNKHNISTEHVLERMFGAHAAAFWLDGECAGPQRLLESASDTAVAAAGASGTSPRLSYFGALDRAGAYAVEYLPEQRIRKHTVVEAGNGSSTVTQQLPCGNIFQFLRDQLAQAVQTEVTVTCTTYGSNKTFSNKTALPFNMTEGYFGYLGYEVGHEAVRILTAQTSGADRYDLSVPLGKPAESAAGEGKSEGGELPLAVLLRPVQYVVYDHTQSTYYAVQIEDAGPDTRPGPAAQDFLSNLADILGEPPGPEVPTPSSTRTVEVSNTPQTRLHAWKSRDAYKADIASCLESIRSGETYEVCLTQQFEGPLQVPPTPPSALSSARTTEASPAERSAVGSVGYLGAYKVLRRRNPAPYACYLRYDPDALRYPGQAPGSADSGLAVCSSSPECFLKAAQVILA
jgi:para-aminobenzoate synthetase